MNGSEEVCKAKVHLILASGDTPAVADLMHHGSHVSLNGCRFCKVTGRHPDNQSYGMYFVSTNSPMRTKEQLERGDPVSYKIIRIMQTFQLTFTLLV